MQNKIEFEEAVVKIPKCLARLIEDQHYFGRNKDKFLTDCIREGVCCSIADLPLDEMHRLERKFKATSELCVQPDKVTL